MLDWFSGVKFYVALAIVAALIGLAGCAYIEYQRAELATKDAETFKQQRDALHDTVVQEEKDKKDLMAQNAKLDQLNVAQRKRLEELERVKRAIAIELAALKATLPKEDQDCMARPLPSSVLDFLRGTADGHAISASADPGKPPSSVRDTSAH